MAKKIAETINDFLHPDDSKNKEAVAPAEVKKQEVKKPLDAGAKKHQHKKFDKFKRGN